MKHSKPKNLSDYPEDWILAAETYENLGTLQKTADALGIKLQTVRGRLNRMGVKLRPPGHHEGCEVLITSQECRELRCRRGLSQTKLAELCGLARPTINMFENGRRLPQEETQRKIISILNDETLKF
jgi:DNA-binding XRE family transcriptional regulator